MAHPCGADEMRFEHLMPLSPQTVAALRDLQALAGNSPFVFPSPGKEGFMSNNTMLFALYRLGWHGRATVHGFRGVASTWLNEAGYPTDWIERQLAHDERNEVRGPTTARSTFRAAGRCCASGRATSTASRRETRNRAGEWWLRPNEALSPGCDITPHSWFAGFVRGRERA